MSNNVFEIEEYLQDNNVFVSGINGRPAHSDSYMTVVDYSNLDKCFEKAIFTTDEWYEAIAYWLENINMQPPLKIVAKTVQRKIEKL